MTYYVATNLVVAIVGDLDRGQAEDLVERLTADMKRGKKAPVLPKVLIRKGKSVQQKFPASQTHIYLGQPAMSRGDPDYFPLYVGNHLFGGNGLVSILSGEVRESRGLSYSVYSSFFPMRTSGPFLMSAQTRNDKAEEALTVMRSTLAEFIRNGPKAEGLEATKQNLTGGFPLRIASNGKIVEYIAMMGFYDYPLDYLDTYVEQVNAVTGAQIQDAFQRRLNLDNFFTVLVGGK